MIYCVSTYALHAWCTCIKMDALQLTCSCSLQEIRNETAALMEQSNEIQQVLGRSYSLHNYDYSEEDVEARKSPCIS